MPDTPRGMRDFSPADAIAMKHILGVTEEVFKRFGFYPIETPAVELKNVLNAKAYGEESTKELFEINGEEAGLRYDFTVPLARYVASNKDLSLPFKRYQIGAIWRKDEPQRMRYREFLQADIDIVGSSDLNSNAEIIAASSMVLEELGIRDYLIVLNDRELLQEIIRYFKVPADRFVPTMRILDKLPKSDRKDVVKLLTDSGMTVNSAGELLDFILQQNASNDERLQRVSANIDGAAEQVGRMKELLRILGEYKLSGRVVVDLSLARGLDYYTGFVWELVMLENGKRLPSVAGGGRFDNLIGIYSKKGLPACGISIGIGRLFDLVAPKKGARTYAKVFLAYLGGNNRGYAVKVANMLRGSGIYTDLNLTDRSLSKQLEYASSLGVMYVIIIGNKEREAGKIRLRNMLNGREELLSAQEAVDRIGS